MIITDVGLVERKTKILKIGDLQQRDKEIALWATEYLGDYFFISPPSPPPPVVEYYKFSQDIRSKMNQYPKEYEKFWNSPMVKDFFEENKRIENTNDANYNFLKWMREILQNELEVVEIDQAINTHTSQKRKINQTLPPVRAKIEQPPWTD